MASPPRPSYIGPGTTVAVAVLVATSITVALLSLPWDTARAIELGALGTAYGLGAIPGARAAERSGQRGALLFFFGGMLTLGCAIIALSRGQALLIVMALISEAVLYLTLRAAIAMTLALTAWIALCFLRAGSSPGSVVQGCASFLAAAAFVMVFTRIAVKEREARDRATALAGELAAANEKLREYAAKIEDLATINERSRLAREIHDTLGHSLTVIHVQLEAARALMATDQARALDALRRSLDLTTEGLNEVRRSVAMLRASPLEGKPLAHAMERLVDETRSTGMDALLAIRGEARPLSPPVEFVLYRAAQEALTNVRKHARAGKVEVCLAYEDRVVRLDVADDGIGRDAPAAETDGFGLMGVRERVALVGGSFSVDTEPGRGFKLAVEVPA